MIYLDNAATTWPKPPGLAAALSDVLRERGANPGRGHYRMAQETTDAVYDCRCRVASFFGVRAPEYAVYTPSCTQAVNYVLKGVLSAGDHVVISDLEHNAVSRPVQALARRGVQYSVARVHENDPDATVAEFRRCLRVNTRLIFCTHASNVFGIRLPIEEIGGLAHRSGLLFGVDCAQSAGTAPLDLRTLEADFLCMPAHKGLYGTMGLGLLLLNTNAPLRTVIEGGTGSLSGLRTQPDALPDRFESGTLNVPGIAALDVGLRFLSGITRERVEAHEMSLIQSAYDAIADIPRCELFTARPAVPTHVPLLSFGVKDTPSDEIAMRLGERGIAVRAGLHCAGDAHRAMGTEKTGTVRICPSVFTSAEEMYTFLTALEQIARA